MKLWVSCRLPSQLAAIKQIRSSVEWVLRVWAEIEPNFSKTFPNLRRLVISRKSLFTRITTLATDTDEELDKMFLSALAVREKDGLEVCFVDWEFEHN